LEAGVLGLQRRGLGLRYCIERVGRHTQVDVSPEAGEEHHVALDQLQGPLENRSLVAVDRLPDAAHVVPVEVALGLFEDRVEGGRVTSVLGGIYAGVERVELPVRQGDVCDGIQVLNLSWPRADAQLRD